MIKKRQFIPESLEYVFFTQLADYQYYPQDADTFSFLASQIYVSESDTLSTPIYFGQKIKQAISFLKAARDAQRTIEEKTIINFLNKIKNQYSERKNPPPPYIDKLLEQVKNASPEKLIVYINLIRQATSDYKHRLSELKGQLDRKKSIALRGQKESIAFLLSQNISFQADTATLPIYMETRNGKMSIEELTLKKGYQTIYQELQNNFEPLIKEATKKLIQQMPKPLRDNQIEAILYTSIFLDFSHYLETIASNIQDLCDTQQSQIGSQIAEYTKKNTFLRQLLNNVSKEAVATNQLIEITNNLQALLHIRMEKLSFLQGSWENDKAFFDDQLVKTTNRHKLLNLSLSRLLPKNGTYITVDPHTKTSQGNFYEALMTLFSNAKNVKRNAGTDIIFYSGSLTLHNDKLLSDIDKAISNDFDVQKGILLEAHPRDQLAKKTKTIEAQVKRQQKLNAEVTKTITEYLQAINSTGEIINDFISYDTMKMYWDDSGELDGRDMQLLPALAKISAVKGTNQISFDDIYPYILNMSNTTIPGQSTKIHNQLQEYLSYFAALLMFDNLEQIFQPTVQLGQSTIDQLFLYNFQGRFYPMSVILDKIITNVDMLNEKLEGAMSSTVTVRLSQTPPKFPSVPNYRSQSDWINQKNTTIADTRLKIIFSTSFATWLRDSFNS